MLERIVSGAAFSLVTATTDANASLTAGIFIFAVGIVVGLTCVLVMDRMVRRRMERDYREWLAAGAPERRMGERRGAAFRRRAGR